MKAVVVGATGNVGTSVVAAAAGDPQVESILGVARRKPEWTAPAHAVGPRRRRAGRRGEPVPRRGRGGPHRQAVPASAPTGSHLAHERAGEHARLPCRRRREGPGAGIRLIGGRVLARAEGLDRRRVVAHRRLARRQLHAGEGLPGTRPGHVRAGEPRGPGRPAPHRLRLQAGIRQPAAPPVRRAPGSRHAGPAWPDPVRSRPAGLAPPGAARWTPGRLTDWPRSPMCVARSTWPPGPLWMRRCWPGSSAPGLSRCRRGPPGPCSPWGAGCTWSRRRPSKEPGRGEV
jgi:hypothetical protein